METVDVLLVIYVICLLCVIPIWAVKIWSLAFFSIVLNFVSEQNNGSSPSPPHVPRPPPFISVGIKRQVGGHWSSWMFFRSLHLAWVRVGSRAQVSELDIGFLLTYLFWKQIVKRAFWPIGAIQFITSEWKGEITIAPSKTPRKPP